MIKGKKVAVVIPSYKVKKHLAGVINSLPSFIDFVIPVDDVCPENSVVESLKSVTSTNVFPVYHKKNLGVGGAVVSGYKKSIELEADIVVKIDGDGQMDSNRIEDLIAPLLSDQADYSKGNRFRDLYALRSMPTTRLIGNSALSFLLKLASGYWKTMDPTNGFTAINIGILQKLDLDKVAERYFFESDMLIRLNILNAVVVDVPMPAFYGDEESSLSIGKVLGVFPLYLLKGFMRRLFYKYFLYDFNMASVYILMGIPMLLWGLVFGLTKWYMNHQIGEITPTGTVMLSILPLILGTQLLLQAINIDIQNTPMK
jgi:glycosyltransferase involved in cell wall biosynthesis